MTDSIIGIDISKAELAVALIKDKKVIKCKCSNDNSGFKKLQSWLKKNNAGKVKACMEATGSYGFKIADFLYAKNHEVYVVNPLSIHAFAKSMLSRNKTDEADAVIIAEYISKMPAKVYKPCDDSNHELRYLYRCLDDLKSQYIQVNNHLEDKAILPKAVIKTWNKLAENIELQIKNIEASIDNVIKNNVTLKQNYENLQTIPGISKTTAIAVLAETPDISEFANARQFAAYAGVTPKQRQSGSSVKGKSRLSKLGSSKLRKAIFFPAIVAKNHNPIIKEFCLNLKKKSKHNMVIVGAAMRKLMHIIFAILKNKTIFNPNINSTIK
jgi:transposase